MACCLNISYNVNFFTKILLRLEASNVQRQGQATQNHSSFSWCSPSKPQRFYTIDVTGTITNPLAASGRIQNNYAALQSAICSHIRGLPLTPID